MGILITDHNVRETLAITDRAYILNDGAILSSGQSVTVANDQLVRRYYLGEDFQCDPSAQTGHLDALVPA